MTYYVILDNATDRLYKKSGHYGEMRYDTMQGAKCAATRLNKKIGTSRFLWYDINDYLIYRGPVKMVEKTNLMSGKKYMEAEDTPCFMSPACESYWSM